MKILITDIKERRGGDEALLTISLSNGEHIEYREFAVAARMLFEVGNIAGGVIPYELTIEQFDVLEYDAKLWEAAKKGIDLLAYGDNSKKRLSEKLWQRGFDREISEDAACYIEKLGLIDENRQVKHLANQLAGRGFGRSRIKQELIRKGISREVIEDELDDILDEVDFDANLEKLLQKKVDPSLLTNDADGRKYREKIVSAMFRYGYQPSEVREKLRELF